MRSSFDLRSDVNLLLLDAYLFGREECNDGADTNQASFGTGIVGLCIALFLQSPGRALGRDTNEIKRAKN
jgi:hypothetical protein